MVKNDYLELLSPGCVPPFLPRYLGFDPLIEDSGCDVWVRSPEERGCGEVAGADGAHA